MIFLSKPSVFFLPGTWEAQEPITNDTSGGLLTSIIIISLIMYWTLYILPKKMKKDN